MWVIQRRNTQACGTRLQLSRRRVPALSWLRPTDEVVKLPGLAAAHERAELINAVAKRSGPRILRVAQQDHAVPRSDLETLTRCTGAGPPPDGLRFACPARR